MLCFHLYLVFLFFSLLLTLAPMPPFLCLLVKEYTELVLNLKFCFCHVSAWDALPTKTLSCQNPTHLNQVSARHRVISLSEITAFSTPLLLVALSFVVHCGSHYHLKFCYLFVDSSTISLHHLNVMFIIAGICLAHSSQWYLNKWYIVRQGSINEMQGITSLLFLNHTKSLNLSLLFITCV